MGDRSQNQILFLNAASQFPIFDDRGDGVEVEIHIERISLGDSKQLEIEEIASLLLVRIVTSIVVVKFSSHVQIKFLDAVHVYGHLNLGNQLTSFPRISRYKALVVDFVALLSDELLKWNGIVERSIGV